MDPMTSPVKASGLPRFSKLPTPKPVTLTANATDRDTTAKPPSRLATVRGKPSIPTAATPSRPAIPRLESTSRRSSIAAPSFVAPRPPSAQSRRAVSPLKPSNSRLNSGIARPGSRLQSPTKITPPSRDEDANDTLGSLNGFRSASRQSYYEPAPIPEDIPDDIVTPKANKSNRLSLSDRTIESIFQLPSTPGTDRRRSSFFAPESPMVQSPMGPPSRPISALGIAKRPVTSNGSMARPASRPVSPVKRAIPTIQPGKRTSVNPVKPTPTRRTVSASLQRPSITPRPASIAKPNFSASVSSASRPFARQSTTKSTMARPNGIRLAPKSSMAKSTAAAASSTPSARSIPQMDGSSDSPPSFTKSSAALRDQIAKAKTAAKRTATVKHDSLVGKGDFDLNADPFNQRPKEDNKGLIRKRIDSARIDGRLNISSMSLDIIPDEVLKMYDVEAMADSKVSWSETVDLVRLVAADNDFESIAEDCFPDVDAREAADSDGVNYQFGGLEMLDIHANHLLSLPIGLRRLERLTSLNLSHNKLGASALDTICQIPNLKELKLAHNSISGYLPQSITKLQNLEVLELQGNKLLSLPECLRELTHLRVLNVSGNQLTGVPIDALESLPITDLDISSNALVGALFPFGVSGMASLRDLNVANNSLVSLAFSESLHLPAIQTLNVAHNRIVTFPDMTGWTELITLTAEGNKVSLIPSGFTSLNNIKHADFSSNELTRLVDGIALMSSLDRLLLGANPLRERKYLNMSAEQIKADLKARMEPDSTEQQQVVAMSSPFIDEAIDVQSPGVIPSPWKLGVAGALDLGGKKLTDNHSDYLRSFLGVNNVRELSLSTNNFNMIPFELSLAQSLRMLDMSMCNLGDRFMDEAMALPMLQELVLSGNRISSLDPLIAHLYAPGLQHLDVSNNKLSGTFPNLHDSFPELVNLYASDNKIESITPKSLKGLHTAVLSRNNIMHVPPEIGLLWYEGLRGLDIGSNAFRVPSYRVLEKGTEATLSWLRDRIPGYVEDDSETF